MRISDWSSDVCSSDLILSDELRWNLSMGKASEQDTLVLRERKLMQALAYYEGERIQAELSNHEQESQRFTKEASRRSEEGRVGKECVSTCRCGGTPYH